MSLTPTIFRKPGSTKAVLRTDDPPLLLNSRDPSPNRSTKADFNDSIEEVDFSPKNRQKTFKPPFKNSEPPKQADNEEEDAEENTKKKVVKKKVVKGAAKENEEVNIPKSKRKEKADKEEKEEDQEDTKKSSRKPKQTKKSNDEEEEQGEEDADVKKGNRKIPADAKKGGKPGKKKEEVEEKKEGKETKETKGKEDTKGKEETAPVNKNKFKVPSMKLTVKTVDTPKTAEVKGSKKPKEDKEEKSTTKKVVQKGGKDNKEKEKEKEDSKTPRGSKKQAEKEKEKEKEKGKRGKSTDQKKEKNDKKKQAKPKKQKKKGGNDEEEEDAGADEESEKMNESQLSKLLDDDEIEESDEEGGFGYRFQDEEDDDGIDNKGDQMEVVDSKGKGGDKSYWKQNIRRSAAGTKKRKLDQMMNPEELEIEGKKLKNVKLSTKTFMYSGLEEDDVTFLFQTARQLGQFQVDNGAKPIMSHLIYKGGKRTMKLLFAIAKRAWILDISYLYSSVECEDWILEKEHECKDIPDKKFRDACGPLFKEMKFYINTGGKDSLQTASVADLETLIKLAGGKLVEKPEEAQIIIEDEKNKKASIAHKRFEDSKPQFLSYRWLLDSMMKYSKLSYKSYEISL